MENENFPQNQKYHKYDVLEHIYQTVRFAEPEVRVAALFHDIAKARCKKRYGEMHAHPEEGAKIADSVMRRLKFPNAERERAVRLVANHMYDLDCKTGENKLRRFIQRNHDIIDDLAALKNADGAARGFDTETNPSAERLLALRDKMIAEGVPMTLKDLKVGGEDLLSLPIPANKRSEALKSLLTAAAADPVLLSREGQLKFLRGIAR